MTIKIGDRLPEGKFNFIGKDGPQQVSTHDLLCGKKVVLFGLPGAFTPTCSGSHLPGFLENYAAIKAKNVDEIAVISVNDMHVMNAWAIASGGSDKIRFLADGSADYTKALGLEVDLSEVGMGIRSQRYSMIVDDGVVTALNIEDTTKTAELSGAAAILTQL